MHKNLETIIECYSCGLFIRKDLETKIKQRCPRCNSKLETNKVHSNDSLYYAIRCFFTPENYARPTHPASKGLDDVIYQSLFCQ